MTKSSIKPRFIVDNGETMLAYVTIENRKMVSYTTQPSKERSLVDDAIEASKKCKLMGGRLFPKKILNGSRKNKEITREVR